MVFVVVLINVNGGKFIWIFFVLLFLLMMMFKKKFFIVGYRIFLIILFNLWILLINNILFGCNLDNIVVKLFGFFKDGFEMVWIFIFILLVMIFDSVVLFSFGGLNNKIWLSGFCLSLVVLIKIFKLFFIEDWFIYCFNCVGFSDNFKLVFLLWNFWLIIFLFIWFFLLRN